MKFLLGEKIEMTQLWKGDAVVPVTKISAGPCTILQFKTTEKDGYEAVQVGYGARRLSLLTKALVGHFKNFGTFRYVREFRLNNEKLEAQIGDQVSVATFAVGDKLTVTGISKGKGFQGVVKRHGFHGQDATHGNKDQLRASGSVGAGGVQHVFKGTRMGGRMGGDRVTLHDVEIVEIDEATNTIYIKGAVPGARHGLVMIFAQGDLKLGLPEIKVEEPVVAEEVVAPETEQEVVEPVAEVPAEEVKAEETQETRTTENSEKSEDTEKAAEAPIEEPKIEEAPVEEIKSEEVKTEESK